MGTTALAAGVHFDQDAKGAAVGAGLRGEPFDRRLRVGGDSNRATAVAHELAQTRELGLADNIIGDQDVFNASLGHGFGLTDLLADDTDGPRFDLPLGNGRCFVGFGVHAQGDAQLVAGCLQAGNIVIEHVEIDAERWRVEVF